MGGFQQGRFSTRDLLQMFWKGYWNKTRKATLPREISYCEKNLPSGTGGANGEVGLLVAHKLCLMRLLEGHCCPFRWRHHHGHGEDTRSLSPWLQLQEPGSPANPRVPPLTNHVTEACGHLPLPAAAAATQTRHLINSSR